VLRASAVEYAAEAHVVCCCVAHAQLQKLQKGGRVPYGPPFGTSLFRLRTGHLYLVAYIVATSGTACERGLAEVRRARALGT